jgi:UDP-glucose 4-epimerase
LKILVTGGAGYIGSVVVQALVRARHQVVVYDNLSHGYTAAVPSQAEFVQGDISDREKLDFVFSRSSFHAVMHFAASIEAGESMLVPERYFRNNSAATLTLLEAMLAHKVDRLVFSSTAALYGDPERVPISEEEPLPSFWWSRCSPGSTVFMGSGIAACVISTPPEHRKISVRPTSRSRI